RVNPRRGEGSEIGALAIAIVSIAADTGPGRAIVFLSVRRRRDRDVGERRERAANPRAGIILIGDGVDAQMREEAFEVGGRARLLDIQQRLRERVGAAPDGDPERARVVAGDAIIDRLDDAFGARRHVVRANGGHPVGRLAGGDVRAGTIPQPRGGGGDKTFDIEFVRVNQEANHGHLVVRFVRNVGNDEDAIFRDPGVGRRSRAGRGWLRDGGGAGHGGKQEECQRGPICHPYYCYTDWRSMEDRVIHPSVKAVYAGYLLAIVIAGAAMWAIHQYATEPPAWLYAAPLVVLSGPIKAHIQKMTVTLKFHDDHLTMETGLFSRTRRTVDTAK